MVKFINFSNNVLINWGIKGLAWSLLVHEDYTVSYPLSFSTKGFPIFTHCQESPGTGNIAITASNINRFIFSANSLSKYHIHWLAIGY